MEMGIVRRETWDTWRSVGFGGGGGWLRKGTLG